MSIEITCPKCKQAMQEGVILDRGDYGYKMKQVWVEGAPEESFWSSGLKTKNKAMFAVTAYRCPYCHYLEFYTAEEMPPESIWTS
ncbi:MAG TPA: PF20097 family protein [Pyrinomonadaceae bacterium]|nr:PF20097 family protein [Pyrinomonadaceae bacterium]